MYIFGKQIIVNCNQITCSRQNQLQHSPLCFRNGKLKGSPITKIKGYLNEMLYMCNEENQC